MQGAEASGLRDRTQVPNKNTWALGEIDETSSAGAFVLARGGRERERESSVSPSRTEALPARLTRLAVAPPNQKAWDRRGPFPSIESCSRPCLIGAPLTTFQPQNQPHTGARRSLKRAPTHLSFLFERTVGDASFVISLLQAPPLVGRHVEGGAPAVDEPGRWTRASSTEKQEAGGLVGGYCVSSASRAILVESKSAYVRGVMMVVVTSTHDVHTTPVDAQRAEVGAMVAVTTVAVGTLVHSGEAGGMSGFDWVGLASPVGRSPPRF